VPEGNAAKAVRLPTGNVGFYASAGNNVAWTPDGRLVFISNEGGNRDVWVMDSDGNNRKQLTANGVNNVEPVVSADGRYIVHATFREGVRTLWRINIDGSSPLRLTSGPADAFSSLTPDGKWVVFTSLAGSKPTIWKVSIAGGTPEQITDHIALRASVSPDGQWIQFAFPESQDPFAPPNRLAVMPFPGGGEMKVFELGLSGTVATVSEWARDSKSLLYTLNQDNVTNIWSQSIDGGPPKQVTDFKDSLMTGFAWSRDGKQLACSRGALLRDAVLVTDMK
jgi:Tol biopolymer transport system component